MDIDSILQVCTTTICAFSQKESSLQGFELLAYEQSCRTLESVLKTFRENWEAGKDEFENSTE